VDDRTTARRRSVGVLCAAAAFTPIALLTPAAGAAGRDHPRIPVATAPGAPEAPGAPVTGVIQPATRAIRTGAGAGSGAPVTCSAANLAAVQAYVGQALSNRVAQLNALSAAVGGAADLAAGDRSTLSTDLASELSGIQALQAKIPSDTTCQSVIADGRAMVVDFRVYVVMTPQAHLTIAADAESAVAAKLAALEPKLEAAVTSAGQSGPNVAAAQHALSDIEAQVTLGQQSSSGISAQVLGFTPASYPGCWTAFRDDRATLQKGRQALRQADADLHKIVDALR